MAPLSYKMIVAVEWFNNGSAFLISVHFFVLFISNCKKSYSNMSTILLNFYHSTINTYIISEYDLNE